MLEEQIVPLFFERNQKGVPTGWVSVMKQSIKTTAPQYCASRMLKDYTEKLYFPAAEPALAAR